MTSGTTNTASRLERPGALTNPLSPSRAIAGFFYLKLLEYVQMSKKLKIIFGVGYVVVLGLIAFIYRFITDFPIGDDPAIHISYANGPYLDLFKTNYPIPLIIFKFLGQITHVSYQSLFVTLVCTFLFLAGLAVWLLAKKISGFNLVACLSGLFFVSAYWAYDGLRMGLLPETFGWLMLGLALYFLVSKNLVWATIFSLFLPLSHPYSFSIFVLTFIIYSIINLIFGKKEDRQFVLKMLAIYIGVIVAALILRPALLTRFSSFANPEVIGWGERNFFTWFTASQKRRIFLAIFAIVGLASSFRFVKDQKYKLLFSLFFVGLFMAMNQYFDIRFQVFRFAPYLEMPLAIFAALGIVYILEIFQLKRWPKYLALAILSAIILMPQVYANERVTYGMSQIPENNNSMSKGDQEAIAWLKANSTDKENIAAPYKWIIWVVALTGHTNVQSNERLYATGEWSSLVNDTTYIYWPTIIFPPKEQIFNNTKRYTKVFDSNGTVIFRVNYE